MGGDGVVLHDRLLRQVDCGWMDGLGLVVLLLLLSMREAWHFGIAVRCLLSVPSDETPEEPRMIRSGSGGRR